MGLGFRGAELGGFESRASVVTVGVATVIVAVPTVN